MLWWIVLFSLQIDLLQLVWIITNFYDRKDAVHLPMLITDGKYHAGAYFTKQSITLFKKRHSGGTLLSLFGSFIKISKWHFELVDVPIGDDDKVSEVYTSYQGKELRLIIEEFDKTKSKILLTNYFDKNIDVCFIII